MHGKMSGFEKIKEIKCYNKHNPQLINQRYACLAYKSSEIQNLTIKTKIKTIS